MTDAYFGDPCIHCGTPHDEVAPGACPGRKTTLPTYKEIKEAAGKATALPWAADTNLGCRSIKGAKAGLHKQAQYSPVAHTDGISDDSKDMANAKFIVLACNNIVGLAADRERLIEVLRGAEAALERARLAMWMISGPTIGDAEDAENARDRVRAALQAVETPDV